MNSSIRIANKPYHVSCSQAYTLGKNKPYQINKFIDGKKSSKIVEIFDDKSSADEYRRKYHDKWVISFCTIDGDEISAVEIFDTEQEAIRFYENNMRENSDYVKTEQDKEDDRLIMMLEDTFRQNNLPTDILEGLDDDERERMERLRESELADGEYDESTSIAIQRANELLQSVSELYLDKQTIEKHRFIVNKLMFEQQSISSIALQIAILNRILKKTYKEVIKNPSPKNIESLVKLQKMILDLSKYQREYIDSVQTSFKNLKKDADDEMFVRDEPEDAIVVDASTDGSFSTNSRIELTKKLIEFRRETADMKIPLSPNASLVKDKTDPRLEDKAKIYIPDESSSTDSDIPGYEDDGLSSSLNY